MRRLSGWITVAATAVLCVVTLGIIRAHYDRESRLIAEQNVVSLDVAYRSTIEMYRLDVETRLRTQVLKPEVLTILAAAGTEADPAERALLRGRLYRLLLPTYLEMKAEGLRQFHFHLPDGRSFLRFMLPARSDDPLFAARPSVRIANTELRPVTGFEGGMFLPAFRNVFPVLRNGDHLGSVEISLPFERIHENLTRLLPVGEYALLMHRSVTTDVVFPEQRDHFIDAPLHSDYRKENPAISRITRDFVQSATVRLLDPILAADPEVRAGMAEGVGFAVPIVREGRGYIAAFHAIRDPLGVHAAYIVGYTEAPVLVALLRTVEVQAIGAITLLLLAMLAVLALLRNRARLARERQQLALITRNMTDCLYVIDEQGVAVFVNDAALKLLGYAAHELIGARVHDLIHNHARNGNMALEDCPIFDTTRSGEPFWGEEVFVDKAGTPIVVEVHSSPLRQNGVVGGSVTVFRDIGARRRAEERTKLAASVFEHAHEGITITDADSRIVEVNEAFCRITGYARDEVVGRTPRLLSSGLQTPGFYADMWREVVENDHWRGEIWNRRKDGGIYAELLTVTAVRDAAGTVQHYVGVFSDITAAKRHERELERIAHYDPLTGVPNRVLLADRMRQALAQAGRRETTTAICYLDIDGFKDVNDRYGHEVGDGLLVEIVGRLEECLRADDTLARLGGDEFILVLQGLRRDSDWESALDRVLEQIAGTILVEEHAIRVSASIGVTLYPRDDSDPDTLLRHADQAMYLAKQAGRNRWMLFDPDHERRERNQRQNAERVARALRDGEFVLYYQPKVNMRRGVVIGAEALIRWRHPSRGLLAPGEFLPDVENTPVIVDLGDWVVDTALTRLSQWRAHGLDLTVSVNVAARQLQQPGFVPRLEALLAAHPDVAPEHLELEVLETAALEDLAQVSQVIETCQRLGVRFALDDFGTGYSSLTYIKRLPANMLKIDQSFVRDMLTDAEDLSIVEGVIGLAKSFRREVVAEGVESVAHGTLLLELDCEIAQGYGIARPMPAEHFEAWIAGWTPPVEWSAVAARALDRADLPLVVAEVEIRHWMRALEQYVAGAQERLPTSDQQLSRFLSWWREADGYTHLGAYRRVEAIRRAVQTLSDELETLRERGEIEAARAELPKIHALQDEMLACLRTLLAHAERAA